MSRREAVLFGAVALATLGGSAAAPAQSVLAGRGLGYPLEALDARARAMGGLPGGSPGSVFSLSNPAASAGTPAPAASITFQQDWFDATGEGLEAEGSTARFPLIAIAFPVVGRWSASIGYGSFLDQNWGATVRDSIDLVSGRVEVFDRFVSEGGIARLRGGTAYRVNSRLSVGVAAELYTGAVRDTLQRFIGQLTPASFGTSHSFSGSALSAGVRWSPLAALGLTASVTGGGTLTGEAEDSAADRREYNLPLIVDAAATARIARQATLAAGIRWAGWADADADLVARGGARDALTVAAGVEYDGVSVLHAPIPLRLGARMNRLPFRWDEDEFPEERAVTGGLGLVLGRGTAQIDLAAERGWRGGDAAGFDEPYWRGVLTFSIVGR